MEFSEGTRKVSDKKITSTWSLFVSSWSPFFCLELFHSDFASRFAARLSEMLLISLRRRGDCQSWSNKFQRGLFRITALFTSLQPPGHSGFSLLLLFLKRVRLTRARWEVLGHDSWFEEPATAFGAGSFLQVTLLRPLGTKPDRNEDRD